MKEMDWLQMIVYHQELHRFSRTLLTQGQSQSLTSSERELLARLYLEPQENTPLALSRRSGMKKEAVSRCLKKLYEKNCIQKTKHPQDERSYILSLTATGEMELRKDYEAILQPFYDLWRNMGDEFETLFHLICKANKQTDDGFKGGI